VCAQEVSASITGTITDATGALVANASVTAKDVDRGNYVHHDNQRGRRVSVFPA
jgi:hypothetical protein